MNWWTDLKTWQKILFAVGVLVLIVAILPSSDDATTDVAVTITASYESGVVSFEGTATVPDGALIAYEVTQGADLFVDGNTSVRNGEYAGTASVGDADSGNIEVWVAFQTLVRGDTQPTDVIDLYGDLGQNITGDDVVVADEIRRVEAVTTVNAP